MDVHGMSIPHTIGHILGIIPNFSTIPSTTKHKRETADIIRGAIFILFFIAIFIYDFYGSVFVFGKDVHVSDFWVTLFVNISVCTLNILGVYILNIRHGEKLLKFLTALQKTEVNMINKENFANENKKYLLKFGIMQVLGVLFGLFSGFVIITSMGWDLYKYFVMREFRNSHHLVLMCIVIHYSELIGWRMRELNQHLVNSVDNNQIQWINEAQKEKQLTISTISKAYTTITELMDLYNELFGSIILIYCISMVLNILGPVNMALLYLRGISVHIKLSAGTSGAVFVVFCVCWVLFPYMVGLRLFHSCDKTAKEIGKVSRLCYKLISSLGENDIKLKIDLEQYANQAMHMTATFSADGFFEVNNGLIMPIFGAVLTYVIVLMQFHNL